MKTNLHNQSHFKKWNRPGRNKWFTKELAGKLPPLYANAEAKTADTPVILKLFNPTGIGTWYLTEADLETGEAFGLCVLQEAELGYVSLHELRAYTGFAGLPIERDIYYGPETLAEAMEREQRRAA